MGNLENCEAGQPRDKLTRSIEEQMKFRNKNARGKMEFGWVKGNVRKIGLRIFLMDRETVIHSFIH